MANIVKEKLRSGKVTLGAWVMVGHPASGEIQAACGFDWVAVDTEHTSIGFETFDGDDLDGVEALRAHAELALREAKRMGGGQAV